MPHDNESVHKHSTEVSRGNITPLVENTGSNDWVQLSYAVVYIAVTCRQTNSSSCTCTKRLTNYQASAAHCSFYREANLVLVELTVLVFLFALLLERDDDETDEDVDHEERDDDDVDKVEDGDAWTMVGHWTVVLGVRVDASMHQSSSDKPNQLVYGRYRCTVAVPRSSNGVGRINELTVPPARLVLGRVTVFGPANHHGM